MFLPVPPTAHCPAEYFSEHAAWSGIADDCKDHRRPLRSVYSADIFCQLGGWDHHDNVIGNQAVMCLNVSSAVGAFYNALVLLGIRIRSHFLRHRISDARLRRTAEAPITPGEEIISGRRRRERQRIYGKYPELYGDGPADLGRGHLIRRPARTNILPRSRCG